MLRHLLFNASNGVDWFCYICSWIVISLVYVHLVTVLKVECFTRILLIS